MGDPNGFRVLRDAEEKRQALLEELGATTRDAVEVLTKVRDRLESAEAKENRLSTAHRRTAGLEISGRTQPARSGLPYHARRPQGAGC